MEDYRCPGCKVHRGFHNVYEDLSNNLLACVYTMKSNHPLAEIVVTGHSLGASVSTFAAIEI
jgi:alpha-beta hydrolase superfamily lysophospholipase